MKNRKQIALRIVALAALMLPAVAMAQAGGGSDVGLSGTTEFIKSAVRWLFIDAGPWIAVLGLGVLLVAGFSGRMEWANVFKGIVVVAVFFALPSIVNKLREKTQSGLDSLETSVPAADESRRYS